MLAMLGICLCTLAGAGCDTTKTSRCAKVTLKEAPVVAGIRVDKDSLFDAQSVLGVAPIIESGDGGAYRARICYASGDGIIVFFDSNSLGGASKQITSAGVAFKAEFGAGVDRCGIFKNGASDLLVAGLSLGSTVAQVYRVFGKPHDESGEDLKYCCTAQVPMTREEMRAHEGTETGSATGVILAWSIYGEISIVLRGGRVARLEVTRTTSF
jgi:hypothetical protein